MSIEAACLKIEDAEAQRLNPEDGDGSSAPGIRLNNLDRLVNWSKEFLSKRGTYQIYPVLIIRGQQVAMGDSAADRDMKEKNSQRRSTPPAANSTLPRSGEC